MDEKIKEQILSIRDTAKTNMFDTRMVQRLAYEAGYHELVLFIQDNVIDYVNFIAHGDTKKTV